MADIRKMLEKMFLFDFLAVRKVRGKEYEVFNCQNAIFNCS